MPLLVPPRFPPALSPAAAAAPVQPRAGRGPFKAGPWPRPRRHARGSSMETCPGYGAAAGTKLRGGAAAMAARGGGGAEGRARGCSALWRREEGVAQNHELLRKTPIYCPKTSELLPQNPNYCPKT